MCVCICRLQSDIKWVKGFAAASIALPQARTFRAMEIRQFIMSLTQQKNLCFLNYVPKIVKLCAAFLTFCKKAFLFHEKKTLERVVFIRLRLTCAIMCQVLQLHNLSVSLQKNFIVQFYGFST